MRNYAHFVLFTFYTATVFKFLCTKIPGDPNMQIFSVGASYFYDYDLRKIYFSF